MGVVKTRKPAVEAKDVAAKQKTYIQRTAGNPDPTPLPNIGESKLLDLPPDFTVNLRACPRSIMRIYLSLDEALELLDQEAAASPALDGGSRDNTLRELLRDGSIRAYRGENGNLKFVAAEHCYIN